MPKEPNYYQILGVPPEADTEAIGAAYRGRALKFRVKQTNERGAEQAGATQEQIEQAYAILGDPESRALYDAVYFPAKPSTAKRRRRLPIWLWAIVGVWLVALLAAAVFGLRSLMGSDNGTIGGIAGQTPTIIATGGASGTATVSPSGGVASSGAPTIVAALPPATATRTVSGVTATLAVAPSATTEAAIPPTVVPDPTPTAAPTMTAVPTSTATVQPPTSTIAPSPTAVPPTVPPPTIAPPTSVPPLVVAVPEPEPTAPPTFRATDRIGTTLSVNLRTGPGAAYPSLGLLSTGTLLQATGEKATVNGKLWRRFMLEDGRIGWVRDVDVFPAR